MATLKVGDEADAIWRDDPKQLKRCRILDERPSSSSSSSTKARELYIHYHDFDKRLDEWVPESRLSEPVQEILKSSTPNRKVEERRRTRSSMAPPVDGLDIATGADLRPVMPAFLEGGLGIGNRPRGAARARAAAATRDGHAASSSTTSAHDGRRDSISTGGGGPPSNATSSKGATWARLEQEHEELTRIRNIQTIQMGKFHINTWYYSPFPDEYGSCEHLYVCAFCLKYMRKSKSLLKHTCRLRHPPGNEIYRDGQVSLFEVDGKLQKLYCQNLCLLSKLFLDHKTLYFDVSPFLFYVLAEADEDGYQVVGYFSKEKKSAEDFNVACILVFPQHQRKGFGKFLVQASYGLTAREGKVGSPEKPLSDLGKVTYRSYWTWVVLNFLLENPVMSIEELSRRSCFKRDDIVNTLRALDMVRYYKGDHVVHTTVKRVQMQLVKMGISWRNLRFDDSKLEWYPPNKRPRR